MPYKASEARRRKIPRARYTVANWPEYDRSLQQRGSLKVWVTPEALAAWHPPRTGQRGRPRGYSEVAIETGHLLRLAFASVTPGHPVRISACPAGGSPAAMAQVAPRGRPQHRRDPRLRADEQRRGRRVPDRPARRKISSSLASLTAEGADDGAPIYRALAERQPDPPAAVASPPRSTAVPSPHAGMRPSQRDQHIQMIGNKSRTEWQKAVGYGRRSHAKTTMVRYKAIIGGSLRAWTLRAQRTETKVACSVLNSL